MRNAGVSEEMMSTRKCAEELGEKVQAAATALSERRFFSAETMLAAPAWHLASLLLNDPTKKQAEINQTRAELKVGDRATLLRHASQALQAWIPPDFACATFCPEPALAVAPDRARGGGRGQRGANAEERDDVQRDRCAYVSFDRTTVALATAPGGDARAVLELRSPLGEVEAADLLATEDVWSIKKEGVKAQVRFMHALVRLQYEGAERAYDTAMQDYARNPNAENLNDELRSTLNAKP